MELKELTDRTFELFGIDSADNLGSALLDNISNTDKLKAFCDLVDGDLRIDWKQMIMYLNNEENRYLAEFRDALLPELMSGRIEVNDNG